jgi:hypothetical protein
VASLPQIFEPDSKEIIRNNTTAIEQAATRAQYEGTADHDVYQGKQRPWYFEGCEYPQGVDETMTPYEIVRSRLGPVSRLIWTLFYVYVLPKMEEAFIRTKQIETEAKYKPKLLGTMCIRMKDDSKQYYYVRFIERLGSSGYRNVEIVENKHVTGGNSSQHQYICGQITSMPWYVGYAEPWKDNMISSDDLLKYMKTQAGFAIGNTAISHS